MKVLIKSLKESPFESSILFLQRLSVFYALVATLLLQNTWLGADHTRRLFAQAREKVCLFELTVFLKSEVMMLESGRDVYRHNSNAIIACKLALKIFYLVRFIARHVSCESVETQRPLYWNKICYCSFVFVKIESLHAAVIRSNKPNINNTLHISRQ